MSVNINNPNSSENKLNDFLSGGTDGLRAHLGNTIVSGNERELTRLEQYYLYWKFYDGNHYRDFNHALISINYVKAFIDKVNLFLLGSEGFSFKVSSLYNDVITDEESKPLEELILYHWRRNNKSIVAHEMLQMGSVCGDVWMMPTWLEAKRYVKIHVLDSRQCYPIFVNGDYNNLESFEVRQAVELTHPKNYRMYVTRYTKDKVEHWYQKGATIHVPEYNTYTQQHTNDVHEYTKSENPLGFIPIVHIKNRPNSNSFYGRSDCQDILKLNKVYNELHQELKGIIDYYSTPTTVVTGATLKNMKRGLGNVWSGLPPEANVFTLGLDADLSSMTQYMDRLKTAMHEVSDVPENVLGKIQSISGTSAAALQLTYQPLVQQADLKALTYGEGIVELNDMILKIVRTYDKKNPRLKNIIYQEGEMRIEPIFSYGFPTDRMNTLQELQIENSMLMLSRDEGMNRLGKNNVPDLMDKIDEERIREAMTQAEIAKIMAPPPPPMPVETTPPASGPTDKTSDDEEEEDTPPTG